MDVGDLLELEGALHGDGIIREAPEEEHVTGARVLLRDGPDRVVGLEDLVHLSREAPEGLEDVAGGGGGEVSQAPEEQAEEREDGDLGGEGLRGG